MKLRTTLVVSLALGASSAYASNWYGLGMVSHSSASFDHGAADDALATAGATALVPSSKDKSDRWRLQLGYRFNDYLAMEGGYIDLGKAKYRAGYTGGGASGSLQAGGPDILALAMVPVGSRFSLYGEAGAIDAKIKSELSATGPGAAASGSDNRSRVRPIFGLGALYNFTDAMRLRVGYERINNLGDRNLLGSMDMNVYSAGLSYRF